MFKYLIIIAIVFGLVFCHSTSHESIDQFFRKGGNHTNNWAVLVSTSRFWFNYRHSANILGIYRTVKKLGIPDSQIILMLADDMACNLRNPFPGTVFYENNQKSNVYGNEIEVDYRGYDVTVENFIRVLSGRHTSDVPRSKRLLSDQRSNVLIYMSGHGGDEFLKFQDHEEINSSDLGDLFEQMYSKNRYNEILFMVDTCQAATLANNLYSPKVLNIGSSIKKENSYSHHSDGLIGIAVVDRFSYYTISFFENIKIDSEKTIRDLFVSYRSDALLSTAKWRNDLYPRSLDSVYLTEFFGSVTPIELTDKNYPLKRRNIQQISPKEPKIIFAETYDLGSFAHMKMERGLTGREKEENNNFSFRQTQGNLFSFSLISGILFLVVILLYLIFPSLENYFFSFSSSTVKR